MLSTQTRNRAKHYSEQVTAIRIIADAPVFTDNALEAAIAHLLKRSIRMKRGTTFLPCQTNLLKPSRLAVRRHPLIQELVEVSELGLLITGKCD